MTTMLPFQRFWRLPAFIAPSLRTRGQSEKSLNSMNSGKTLKNLKPNCIFKISTSLEDLVNPVQSTRPLPKKNSMPVSSGYWEWIDVNRPTSLSGWSTGRANSKLTQKRWKALCMVKRSSWVSSHRNWRKFKNFAQKKTNERVRKSRNWLNKWTPFQWTVLNDFDPFKIQVASFRKAKFRRKLKVFILFDLF